MELLASLCNLPEPKPYGLVRVVLDADVPTVEAIEVDGVPETAHCTGLATGGRLVYALATSGGVQKLVGLARRGRGWHTEFFQELPDLSDAHGMAILDGYLYVTSTGSDELLRYELRDGGAECGDTIWRASDAGADTHHVNSVATWQNRVVISAFGPKVGDLWRTAVFGYVYDITVGTRLIEGIYQPHSLSTRGGRLYWCESPAGLLCSAEGPLVRVDGYARGLCWISDRLVAIGSSVGRSASRSRGGVVANPADPGGRVGRCGIALCDIRTGTVGHWIDLGGFGTEIFDIVAVV